MANNEPHTHQPKLERDYEVLGKGIWQVIYGDTTVTVEQRLFGLLHQGRLGTPPAPTEGQIRRALRKAIRLHDKGSRADRDQEAKAVGARVFADVPTGRVWASDK